MPVRKHPPSSSEQLDGQSTSLRRSLPRAVLLLTLLPLLVAGSMALIAGSQRLRLRHGDELQDRAMLQAARLQRDFDEIEALIDAAAPRLGRCASEQPDALCGRHPWLLMSEVTERPADGDTRSRWELAGDGALTLHWPEDNGSRVLVWHFPAQIWAQWWQAQAMSSSEKMVLVQGHRHVALRGGQKVAIQDLAISPAWLASQTGTGRSPDPGTGPHPQTPVPWRWGRSVVPDTSLSLIVLESGSTYQKDLLRDGLRITIAVIAISLLSAFIAWRFASQLAHAIRQVATGARAVLKGHFLSAQVDLDRKDELGLLARSFNHMSLDLERRNRERDVFGRLVSPEVRDKLMHGELMLGGHEVECAVLICDIRGFTARCENMKPRDVVLLLNDYFTRMTHAVQRYGGYVNNFIGDAMIVVFGATEPDERRFEKALYTSMAMREALAEFNRERMSYGETPLEIGVGIASGTALAGQIGSLERCIYTVIGDTVNVAARLETLSKQFPWMSVLINEETWVHLPPTIQAAFDDLGEHHLKGRGQTVHVWGLRREGELPVPDSTLQRLVPEDPDA